jgi:hypothetical protein
MFFSNATPLKSVKITSFSSGDNTVYTVPASTYGVIGQYTGTSSFYYVNGSAGTVQRSWYYVPNGGVIGTGTKVTEGSVISLSSGFAQNLNMTTTQAGDVFSINVNSTAAGQIAWITVQENN